MRHFFFVIGILVLGLTATMWMTAPVIGAKGGHGGGGGGGGHAAAHVGSVHYGARPAPAHVAPARVAPARVAPARAGIGSVGVGPAHTASVRGEHYAGSPNGGSYRNPYRDEYFRHFRPGYLPYVLGDAQYYGYDSLPLGFQIVVINGITYYLFDGVYYRPYIFGGRTVYLAIPTQ